MSFTMKKKGTIEYGLNMTYDSIDLFPFVKLLAFSRIYWCGGGKRQYSIEANKRNNSIKGLRNNKIKSHAHQKKENFLFTLHLFFSHSMISWKSKKSLKLNQRGKHFWCSTINWNSILKTISKLFMRIFFFFVLLKNVWKL